MSGNGGGEPGILYWPTAKAFAALGRPVPDHPAYPYDLVDEWGAVAPPAGSRVERSTDDAGEAHGGTEGPQNGNEGVPAP